MIIEQKRQLSGFLEHLASLLDVTESEFNEITEHYNAVGRFLANTKELSGLGLEIHPQGSFMLGTVVRPVCPEDDIDIDLVCEIQRKPSFWTQKDLKNAIGDRFKESDRYRKVEEGKRCWTINYADNKYHLDVLPSVAADGYSERLKNNFKSVTSNVADLAISITDNTVYNYSSSSIQKEWPISNPFGYAKWFLMNAYRKNVGMQNEAQIDPVPKFNKNKSVLQRCIQILKRHRDIMFKGSDDKPISVIITTLATHSYKGEDCVVDALNSIIEGMENHIKEKNGEKYIANPVNPNENFADKWSANPKRKDNFYKWLGKLKMDFRNLNNQMGLGLMAIHSCFKDMFGESVSTKVFENYGIERNSERREGKLRMAAGTAVLGASGRTAVAGHTFFGKDE